jgi:hypothetical protein
MLRTEKKVSHIRNFVKLCVGFEVLTAVVMSIAREAIRERVASQWGLGNTPSSYPVVPIELLSPLTAHSTWRTVLTLVSCSADLTIRRYIPEDGSVHKTSLETNI